MAERVRRRPGKQPGTTGAALARVGCPDYSVAHVPEHCRVCGQSLETAEVAGSESCQVFWATEAVASRTLRLGIVSSSSTAPGLPGRRGAPFMQIDREEQRSCK